MRLVRVRSVGCVGIAISTDITDEMADAISSKSDSLEPEGY